MENTAPQTTEAPSNVVQLQPPADPKRLPKLYSALAKAQLTIENATMNAENPGFKRGLVVAKYADLAAVMNAIRHPLAENGLVVLHTQTVDPTFKSINVVVRLAHESGEYVETSILIPVLQATPQSVGSSLSYGRRYTTCSVTGLAQEDDDGMGGPMQVPGAKAPPKPKSSKPDTQQEQPTGEQMTQFDQIAAQLKEADSLEAVEKLANTANVMNFGQGTAQREVLRKLFSDRRMALQAAEKKK